METQLTTSKTGLPPGRASLFREKVRSPVSITLTADHHRKVRLNMRRLGLTRADLIGLLIDKYADTVRMDDEQLLRLRPHRTRRVA